MSPMRARCERVGRKPVRGRHGATRDLRSRGRRRIRCARRLVHPGAAASTDRVTPTILLTLQTPLNSGPRSGRVLEGIFEMTSMAIRVALACGTALACASVPVKARAADEAPSGTQIVVTAAGFEQKIVDAPASISVVTAEDLAERPYLTLIDAVRDLEGVDVGETSDKTGQRTISIRGMGSDYTLVLINGKRQNNHGDIYPNSFGGNQFNHIPPLDTVERIEVIRGPASTLYGADALGGVINIITKPVSPVWSGSATVGAASRKTAASV